MDDALRVNDDVDALHLDVEEPARFDHLEAFVEEGRRIDRDLLAHFPGGVLERLRLGHGRQLVSRQLAKRTAGRGENEP